MERPKGRNGFHFVSDACPIMPTQRLAQQTRLRPISQALRGTLADGDAVVLGVDGIAARCNCSRNGSAVSHEAIRRLVEIGLKAEKGQQFRAVPA